uniref:KilA-N domain-containing protein n=1 Tax=viral metagenome TaxID=1070528 RepID=A0A6C0CBK2_9ZZZZ
MIANDKINNDYYRSRYETFSIIVMIKNGYVNATKICKIYSKEFRQWKVNKTSREILQELSNVTGISLNKLTKTVAGGRTIDIRGIYVHPDLITHIAYWCSPRFAVKIGKWINEWRKFSNENEIRFYDALSTIETSPNAQREKEIQTMLHKKLGGKIEVKTSDGRIDLLTDEYLIEIKKYDDWMCAVGQVLMYGCEYDDRKKIIYLFDVPEDNNLSRVQRKCKKYNITVRTIK